MSDTKAAPIRYTASDLQTYFPLMYKTLVATRHQDYLKTHVEFLLPVFKECFHFSKTTGTGRNKVPAPETPDGVPLQLGEDLFEMTQIKDCAYNYQDRIGDAFDLLCTMGREQEVTSQLTQQERAVLGRWTDMWLSTKIPRVDYGIGLNNLASVLSREVSVVTEEHTATLKFIQEACGLTANSEITALTDGLQLSFTDVTLDAANQLEARAKGLRSSIFCADDNSSAQA